MPMRTISERAAASGGARAVLRDPARLVAARRAAHLSQASLADATGCHKSLIGHLEVGRVDSVYVVLADAIAAAVHTPAADLFTTGSNQ